MSYDEDEPTQPLSLDELHREMGGKRREEPVDPDDHASLPAPNPSAPVDRADVIGEGAKAFAAWSGRFLLMAAAIALTFWTLGQVREALIPLLLALLIASVLYPVVSGLRRIGVPHGIGALVSLLLGAGLIGGLVSLIAPSVVSQWPVLADQTVKGIRKVQNWASGPPLNIHDEQLNRYLGQLTDWLQGHSEDLVSIALNVSGSVSSGLVTLAMTLVIVFFMLKDGHKFVGWARSVVGRRGGFHVSELFTRLWNTLSGYIRTQAIVSMVDAVFIGGGLWLMKVPLAFPIAVLTFMAGFIPIVGAVTAGGVAVLVALVTGDVVQALLVLGLVILVQQLEGNILQPVLQSRVMELHPVVIILAVLLGGGWFGIIGAFLAVPVAAASAVVLRYLGDMIDLRTGERVASDIDWATDDGHVVGGESEKSARFFQDLVLRRVRSTHDHDSDAGQPSVAVDEGDSRNPVTSVFRKLKRRGKHHDDEAPSE